MPGGAWLLFQLDLPAPVVPPTTRPRMPDASTIAGTGPDPRWAITAASVLDASTAAAYGPDPAWATAEPDEGS